MRAAESRRLYRGMEEQTKRASMTRKWRYFDVDLYKRSLDLMNEPDKSLILRCGRSVLMEVGLEQREEKKEHN